MKTLKNSILLTSVFFASYSFAMESGQKALSMQAIKVELFGNRPEATNSNPLDLNCIHNIDHVLKIVHKETAENIIELGNHSAHLKELSDLGVYWTPGQPGNDHIKDELLPKALTELRARMRATIDNFANYMVIQELALRKIEEKYEKQLQKEAPTCTHQTERPFIGVP